MKLLTIILNYKTAAMTLEAVAAAHLAMQHIPSAHITIVDNDSQDGSAEALRLGVEKAGYGARVSVVESGRNGGFGAGNNFAMRRALASEDPPEFVYILNSDAFPEEDAIEALLRFLESHPEVGMAGSYIYGTDGVPHETAFRFPSVWSEIESGMALGVVSKMLAAYKIPIIPMPSESRQVDWLAGASLMIRRAVLEKIGLFDETFFLYFEETDLCRRALRAGWPTWYIVESRVAHVGSASTGMKKWKRIPRYWLESRAHYFHKNHGGGYLDAANMAFALSNASFRLRRKLQGKTDPHPPGFYRDFVRFNFRKKY